MDRDALIHRLAETIAGDSELLLDGWTHLVLTSRIGYGMLNMNGFCYTDEGDAVPVSPRDFSIFDMLQELRDAMAKADSKGAMDRRALSYRAQDRQARCRLRVRAHQALGHHTRQCHGARP